MMQRFLIDVLGPDIWPLGVIFGCVILFFLIISIMVIAVERYNR
jgi:hypothetical protein